VNENLISIAYLAASAAFILALKWMSSVPTARRGVAIGAIGMALAIGGTLLSPEIVSYRNIAIALVLGTMLGVPMAMMPMTAVPQRTALSHAFGALAAALVGTAEYSLRYQTIDRITMFALTIEVLLGFLTFSASLMAFGKLQEILPQRPITYGGQNIVNLAVLGVALLLGGVLVASPQQTMLFPIMAILAFTFGIMLIVPIGGADMPTVIALLNSYAGLAAAAMGFALDNKLLIIAGSLDGASGLILSIIMCKAMNRSFTNVLFGAFGQVQAGPAGKVEAKPVKSATSEEAASILANANLVVVIPGYGMAVAQAQHKVRELHDVLMKKGARVVFAIHPVAGRMPGHMNVLLAEADVPYDRLLEMEDANRELPEADVALVIGANDVTNPAARHDKSSPVYGMPIIDVDKAHVVMVIKRSMNPGFAGIDNELYTMDKTLMLFGDAKAVVGDLVKEIGAAE